MIDQVSINAYHEAQDSGLTKKRATQVKSVLRRFGPKTAQQVFEVMVREGSIRGSKHQFNINARLNDLMREGMVIKFDKVINERSGKLVWRFMLTDGEPLEKRKLRKQCEACKGRGYIHLTKDDFF